MVPGILGKKIGMTQIFDEDGVVTPVTVLQAGPCVVVQRKTAAKDGYEAVQVGLVEFLKESRVNKPTKGRFAKVGVEPARYLREFKLKGSAAAEEINPGDRVLASQFKPAQKLDVTANSKGRGFQGVIKRHGFSGGPDGHGSMSHRVPGSIGQCSYPSKVLKGTRMGGRYGGKRVTTVGLEIMQILEEDNVILVRGAVPGPNGGYVEMRRSRK